MSDKIQAALQKLDPANENHWTADGSARLETVKFNNGGEAISREEIDAAFPGFNKDTAKDFAWPEAGHQPATDPAPSGDDVTGKVEQPGDPAAVHSDNGNPTGIDANGAPSAQLGDKAGGELAHKVDEAGNKLGIDAEGKTSAIEVAGGVPGAPAPGAPFNPERSEPTRAPGTSGLVAAAGLTLSPREDGAVQAPQAAQPGDAPADRASDEAELRQVAERVAAEDDVEALEEELEEVEEALGDLTRHLDSLNKEKDKFNEHADRLRNRLAALRGSGDTGTIQAYLESRKQALQLRGENKQTLKDAGLKLKDIVKAVSGSPIDQAMSRKTARGGKRPTRV